MNPLVFGDDQLIRPIKVKTPRKQTNNQIAGSTNSRAVDGFCDKRKIAETVSSPKSI